MRKTTKKTLDFKSLFELQKHFNTEQKCRDFFEQARWNGKITCPHCESDRISKYTNGRIYFCSKCRKQFTVKVGTIFEDSPIKLQKWFFAIYLMTAHKKGISSLQLSRDIGVTQKSAWFMTQRIRFAMKSKSLFKPLSNIVECDETYIGGKKIRNSKRGRGAEHKTPVFGMVERQGELFTIPVENCKKKTLQSIINEKVDKEARIITDEWLAYKGLNKNYKMHNIVNHSRKEYVNGDIHVNTIEGFWSLLKRGIVGIYHSVSAKHLHRYCNEFNFRYNTKDLKDPNRFTSALNNLEGRLTYKTLIASE